MVFILKKEEESSVSLNVSQFTTLIKLCPYNEVSKVRTQKQSSTQVTAQGLNGLSNVQSSMMLKGTTQL